MANRCPASFTVTGSRKEIKELYGIFLKALLRDYGIEYKTIYGALYNLYLELGANAGSIYYRGDFMGLELIDDKTLEFHTDTAWRPPLELLEFITIKFPTLKYYFISGCEDVMLLTNDDEKLYYSYDDEYEIWDKATIQANIPKSFYQTYKN